MVVMEVEVMVHSLLDKGSEVVLGRLPGLVGLWLSHVFIIFSQIIKALFNGGG